MIKFMKFCLLPFYIIGTVAGGLCVSAITLATVMVSYAKGSYRAYKEFYEADDRKQ